MDLDLRKLRYFVAVAEELNFGRAAARLHIAQPVLSRQIRALEDELHARLFDRDNRATSLTAAGAALLADARPLLASASAARARVADAERGVAVLRVGFMPGLTVTAAVRAMGERHAELVVEVVRTTWFDQVTTLHDGRVDVGLVRLPVEQRGLDVRPLFTEPRVVAVPADHPLAGKESVRIADLAAEHLLQEPDAVPEWRDVALELRAGSPRPVPVFGSVEEKLEHVAAGHGMSVLPRSAAEYYRRPDVAVVAVEDIAPNQVCLAWARANPSPWLAEFAELAERSTTA